MSERNHGYPTELPYIKHVFNMLSPASLNYCLSLSGRRAVNLEEPFRYMELGSGFGLSVAGWAAQFPKAEFHAVDINREHTDWTSHLAKEAGLDNLLVHACSVREVLDKDLPSFDFVIVHGLYSWVDDEVRGDIRAFLDKFLKPGGCVYMGYNAMPGNKDVEPMRRIIRYEQNKQSRHDLRKGLEKGLATLEALCCHGSPFFRESPQAVAKLRAWQKASPEYLMAELGAEQSQSYYFEDIYAQLRKLGLSFAGSAYLPNHLDGISIGPQFMELLDSAGADLCRRETLRDFYHNTSFRYDLFTRGTATQCRADQEEISRALASTRLCLGQVRKPMPREGSRLAFRAALKPEIYAPVQAVLVGGPASLLDIANLCGIPFMHALEAATVLMALEWALPALPVSAEVSERVTRFNMALLKVEGEERMMPLLSGRGAWIDCEQELFCFYLRARLSGKDPAQYIFDRACPETESEQEKNELMVSIQAYLRRTEAVMNLFLRRHALKTREVQG